MKEARARQMAWLVITLVVCGTVAVSVAPVAAQAVMEVMPDFSIVSGISGPVGGPFSAPSVTYTVSNRGSAEPLSWCAANSQPWVTLSTECGTLEPGASATVTASLVQAVTTALPADGYSAPIVFTNLTNNTFLTQEGLVSTGTTRRFVTLNVLGAESPQGFGAGTRGGADGAVFHVTTLEDNGDDASPVPGSLRDAVSQRNRHIVFDVAGTIVLQTFLWVQADHVTIDGFTAPAPGITLTRFGIIIRGNRGAHDVVVRGLRIRDIAESHLADSQWDGIQVSNGAFNILVDHVSVAGADDGSIDITTAAHDVTVRWSIVGPSRSGKNMLVKYGVSRVTLHHNVFLGTGTRNPQIENDEAWTPATQLMVDMRNNVVWDFNVGTLVAKGATANVVSNYYSQATHALVVQTRGRAHAEGNAVHASLVDVNGPGTEPTAFPAPAVPTSDALQAACEVHGGAGARPLDDFDHALLAPLAQAGLPEGPCTAVAVVKTGSGDGTVVSSAGVIDCGSRCAALVDEGTPLTLTATPFTGSTFTGFSGDADCADGRLTVSTATLCVATFEYRPDLTVSALTGPAGAEPGGVLAMRHTTYNRAGTGPAGSTTLRFYLSTNTVLGVGDQLVASATVDPLAAGQSRTAVTGVPVPPGTLPGIYFVIAQADALGAHTETSETNNTRSFRVFVGADLSVPTVTAPTTAAPGSPILVTVVTANAAGVGPAPASVTRLYLSRDTVPTPAEMIAERTVGRLETGLRDTWRPTVTIPAGLAAGTYYLIARSDDDGEVVEIRETNNGRIRAIAIRP